MSNNAPIGVFDSGIGGLTVVKELMELMPGEELIYFGDTARTPYGSRPPAEIIQFMHQILNFLAAKRVKMAVVACNTMTALGLELARKQYPFPLVGVNTGVQSALKVSRHQNIGVIATQATIASGNHYKAIQLQNPQAIVYPQACPKFVPLIEQVHLVGALIEDATLEYLVPLKQAGVDTLILGCTHYPLISPLIRQVMGPNTVLVDPARETALDAYNMLVTTGQLANRERVQSRLCFSADVERAEKLAMLVLPKPLPDFELVNLQEFS